jgi:RimJ/RimL family protein N-acetyltransferase
VTPYRIETARLVLRCYDPSDAPLLKDAVDRSLEHLRAWMPWTPDDPEPLPVVYERLREFRAQYDRDENWIMGIFAPDGSRLLGGTGLHPSHEGREGCEIGYWIAADVIGRGYATEAAAVLTRVGIELLGLDRLVIRVDPANVKSDRVPEKLGFSKEATLHRRLPPNQGSDLRDTHIWAFFASGLAESRCADYGYTAYDALGRTITPSSSA